MTTSFIVTEKDDEVLGVANSLDGMGVLAIWTTRAEVIVPNLTGQTRSAAGFQVLLEAFRLWEHHVALRPEDGERVSDFFILVEQAFARIVASAEGDWSLPGRNRVRARLDEVPHLSLDPTQGWTLLGNQKSTGLWGLYRGAAGRAGLLDPSLDRLSIEAEQALVDMPVLTGRARDRLLALIAQAMDGATVELPTDGRDGVVKQIRDGFAALPASELIRESLVDATDLTSTLAALLTATDEPDHRQVLLAAAKAQPDFEADLRDAIRCEDFVAAFESVFRALCASTRDRRHLAAAAEELPVDLAAIDAARHGFADSGHYTGIARERQRQFTTQLRTDTKLDLARSVLDLHASVAKGRDRARWAWEEDGRLVGDVDLGMPGDDQFQPGIAWRNDYFLSSLRSLALGLQGAADD